MIPGFAFASEIPPETQEVELTIFHTNDIHSHLKVSRGHDFGLGNLARLASLIQQRQKLLGGPSVILDAGDWSEGNWYYNVDHGSNMLRFLGRMGFDAVVVGNHDYFNGPDVLIHTVLNASRSKIPVVLAENLDFTDYSRQGYFRKWIPGTTIIHRGGIKVGVIGLTTEKREYSNYILPIRVTDLIDSTQKAVDSLRDQVDVMIVLSHNKFSENIKIAEKVEGIDAVVSGHAHDRRRKPVVVERKGKKIPIVEAGEWAQFLGELKLKIKKENGKASVNFDYYQLHAVTPQIPKDPEISKMIEEEDQKLSKMAGQSIEDVVAYSKVDIDRIRGYEANLAHLASKAYRWVTGVDMALELLPITGVGIRKGPVTLQDLHDVMPHWYDPVTKREWTILIWKASASNLRKIARFMPLVNRVAGNVVIIGDGLEYIWKSGKIPRIQELWVDGKEIQDDKTYTIALTHGLKRALMSLSTKYRFTLDFSELEDSEMEASQAIIRYGKYLKEITEENLKKNSSVRVAGRDLAVYGYGIEWKKDHLEVQVGNEGMKWSNLYDLKCYLGKKNDFTGYRSYSEEPYQSVPTFSGAPLKAGERITARIPLKLDPGYWPVYCKIDTEDDDFGENNSVRTLLQIPY